MRLKKVAGIAGLAVGAFLLDAGVLAPRRFRLFEAPLAVPGWPPSLDGLRVALISDLHAGSPWVDLARVRGVVETSLAALGFDVRVADREAHLCCGSAGTYSVLQPELANALRDRKLANLDELAPAAIISANIGCIQHLQSGTTTPVRHWIEVLDDALAR